MLPAASSVTATGESSRVSLPAMTAVGIASPVAPAANTVMLFAPSLATYSGLPTTCPVTVTVPDAESPAAAAVTTAVPAVVPAVNVVAVVPAASVCPLVTSSGGVPAVPGSAVTLQASVAPASGAPCKSCRVAGDGMGASARAGPAGGGTAAGAGGPALHRDPGRH